MEEQTTEDYILSLAEILLQGNWIEEKTYRRIEQEIESYGWFKKGMILDALKHEIDMQRPWKSRKHPSDLTVEEALNTAETENTSPF